MSDPSVPAARPALSVPDPGRLDLCAVTAAGHAEVLRVRAVRLHRLAGTSAWAGPAARAFRAETATLAGNLRRAADGLDASAQHWRRAAAGARAAQDALVRGHR